jgi:hypothetical protein
MWYRLSQTIGGWEVRAMKMKLKMGGTDFFEKFSVTGTAKGDYPKQSAEPIPAPSKSLFHRSLETLTDLQSYALMEERYGIREEGIF